MFEIRTAEMSDAQAISDIYNYYVETSTCTFDLDPEPLAKRCEWLEAHKNQHPAVVSTHKDAVVGWGSLSPFHPRPAYSRTAEVSFYVHHDWHRRGIGRIMLADLIERARQWKHHVLIGGACTEQVASIKLQERFGFVEVARFNEVGFKFDRWLDVVYLQLNLNPPQE